MFLTFPWLCPTLLRGESQIVFFILIGLVWLIANVLRKASQASKGPTTKRPQSTIRPERETEATPRRGTLSEFLRRIQEMSEQEGQPRASQDVEVEEPVGGTFVPTPSLPRKPTIPKRTAPRREAVRKPNPRLVPTLEKRLEPKAAPLASSLSVSAAPLEIEPYWTTNAAEQPPITRFLGSAVSASEMKKGIVLAEILGRPKALRGRRTRLRPR